MNSCRWFTFLLVYLMQFVDAYFPITSNIAEEILQVLLLHILEQ
jgi:hypothetical protein